MKKLTLVLAAAVTLLFAGCAGVEDKSAGYAKDMIEAINKKDFDKADKVQKEYDEWYESLSEEDQARARAAMTEVAEKVLSETLNED